MKPASLCLLLLLAACRDQRPPGPTSEQSAQLNDAENMLNAEAANEEDSNTNASGPAAPAP